MRWVIGDIHGMFQMLETMLLALSKLDKQPVYYFVGDYVNRGPMSKDVLDLLLSLRSAKFCRGNHDDVLDLILHDQWMGGEDDTFDPLSACTWFLKHGLAETVLSYGVDVDELEFLRYHPSEHLLGFIRNTIPRRHADFIRKLPMFIDDDDALIMHAFWPVEEDNDTPRIAARLQDAAMRHRVVWERYKPGQIMRDKPWSRPLFAGHTPVQNYPLLRDDEECRPIRGQKLTLLDTAAALGDDGRLTAVCIEDGRVVQINRRCRVVG
jgi:serine/threonine protein phosphatase 1